jgi:hypothetical protein
MEGNRPVSFGSDKGFGMFVSQRKSVFEENLLRLKQQSEPF